MGSDTSILKHLLIGLIGAIIFSIPLYAMAFDTGWEWATQRPVSWLHITADYMGTFFHELGHCIAMFFYGYIALPAFDFAHGGGVAVPIFHNPWVIYPIIYAGLAFAAYLSRGHIGNMILVGLVFAAHLGTAYNETAQDVVIAYSGLGAEALVGGFLLYTALVNWAPFGEVKQRLAHYIFGLTFLAYQFIDGIALMDKTSVSRALYFSQKGKEGAGDLDKMAMDLSMPFQSVVTIHMLFSALCLVGAFILFFLHNRHNQAIAAQDMEMMNKRSLKARRLRDR